MHGAAESVQASLVATVRRSFSLLRFALARGFSLAGRVVYP